MNYTSQRNSSVQLESQTSFSFAFPSWDLVTLNQNAAREHNRKDKTNDKCSTFIK